MKKNKLLLITPYNKKHLRFYRGGIGIWSIGFINELTKHHVAFSVINTAPIGKRLTKNNHKSSIVVELWRAAKIILSTLIKVIFFRPTIVHLNSSGAGSGLKRDLWCLRLIPRKTRVILHMHCNLDHVLANPKALATWQACMKRTTTALVLNEQSLSFANNLGYTNVKMMPNFINDELVAENHIINSELKKIVFVGFVQKLKGFYELLDVAKQLPDLQFSLIGTPDKDAQLVELPANVKIKTVERHEVFTNLDQSDLFFFPTHSEGFSMALLEAMARGLPIVTTDIGANMMMVENSKGGVVVNVGDTAAMVKAIESLKDPQIRTQMSQNNINKVKNNYMTSVVYQQVIDTYRE